MRYYVRSGSDPRVMGPVSEKDVRGMYLRGTPHLWVSSDAQPAFVQLHQAFVWAAPAGKSWSTVGVLGVVFAALVFLACFVLAIQFFFLS